MYSNSNYIAKMIDEGKIPGFLFEIWKDKHDGRNPIKDRLTANRIESVRSWAMMVSTLSLIVFLVFISDNEFGLSDTTLKLIATISGIILVASLAVSFGVFTGKSAAKNSQKCLSEIYELMQVFRIRASTELAQIPKEEFRAMVEMMLRNKAESICNADGFDKVELRDQFNKMHSTALAWNMCHENHGRYFPKKEEVKK